MQLGNTNKLKTSDFAQYEHLAYLSALTAQNAQLVASLGNDYLVAPDVVVDYPLQYHCCLRTKKDISLSTV